MYAQTHTHTQSKVRKHIVSEAEGKRRYCRQLMWLGFELNKLKRKAGED